MIRWLVKLSGSAGRQRGCRACGICCELYGHALRASASDLARWQGEGRHDLLLRVGADRRLWCDPATGAHLEDCPFLRRSPRQAALCRIHSTKPELCRDYPTVAHRSRCVCGVRFDD